MIKLENTEVLGWEAAIRGMRNPMNSWDKSDSDWFDIQEWNTPPDEENYKWVKEGQCDFCYAVGPNDQNLMMHLAKAGSVDAKYRRMIVVTVDITAPLYWWKEFDTYKVGTVANSCSTMHKIHSKEFTLEDFSHEHLFDQPNFEDIPHFEDKQMEDGSWYWWYDQECVWHEDHGAYDSWLKYSEEGCRSDDYVEAEYAMDILNTTIRALNHYRAKFLETKDKRYWWQMIQLLPSSYNQRRTVMLNYEVLAGIYPKRKDHKLDEWHNFCDWIKSLPYSEIITLEE